MTDTFRELPEMPPSGILMTLHVGDNSPRRISTAMVDGVRTTLAEAVLVTEELTLVGKGFIAGGGTHTHCRCREQAAETQVSASSVQMLAHKCTLCRTTLSEERSSAVRVE